MTDTVTGDTESCVVAISPISQTHIKLTIVRFDPDLTNFLQKPVTIERSHWFLRPKIRPFMFNSLCEPIVKREGRQVTRRDSYLEDKRKDCDLKE